MERTMLDPQNVCNSLDRSLRNWHPHVLPPPPRPPPPPRSAAPPAPRPRRWRRAGPPPARGICAEYRVLLLWFSLCLSVVVVVDLVDFCFACCFAFCSFLFGGDWGWGGLPAIAGRIAAAIASSQGLLATLPAILACATSHCRPSLATLNSALQLAGAKHTLCCQELLQGLIWPATPYWRQLT